MNKKPFALILVLALFISALLMGCGETKTLDEDSEPSATAVDLSQFYDDMKAAHSIEGMLEAFDDEMIDNYFPGLRDIPMKQKVVYGTMLSMNTMEFVFVEVENSSDVNAVEAILQGRIDAQVGTEESPGGAWYPGAIEAWKNNSAVVSNGNYIAMIVWDEYADIVSDFNVLFA